MERAGITDIARQKTTKLSGGQSQRVRYALALVPDPDLLVLDEPTVAMDVEVRRSFWASMRDFTDSGRTVLFATHYLDEADAFADRVVVLADGVIVADGTGAQIKSIGRPAGPSRRSSPARRPGRPRPTAGRGRRRAGGRPNPTALQRLRHRAAGIAAGYPAAHDIEIAAGNLEDAFLELTAANRQESAPMSTTTRTRPPADRRHDRRATP